VKTKCKVSRDYHVLQCLLRLILAGVLKS